MSETNILPGTYHLSADVTNPKPDRRSKDSDPKAWRNYQVWRKGMVFVATEDPEFHRIRVYYRGGYSMDALREDDPGYTLLAPLLVSVVESPSDYLRRLHSSGSMAGGFALDILDKLQVDRETIDRLLAEIEDEYAAREAEDA